MEEEKKTARSQAKDGGKGNNRPKTAARQGRGARNEAAAGSGANNQGGMGRGSGRGKARPTTGRKAATAAEMEETKERSPRGNNRGGAGRGQQKPQDPNSWIYKYHHMERVQYEKVTFTEDTVIPELP